MQSFSSSEIVEKESTSGICSILSLSGYISRQQSLTSKSHSYKHHYIPKQYLLSGELGHYQTSMTTEALCIFRH